MTYVSADNYVIHTRLIQDIYRYHTINNDHHLSLQIHQPQAQTALLFDEVHRCMQSLETQIKINTISPIFLSPK